ncbi:carboxypeptidase M32 [Weissella confusa]|uniref:carboxypeptidase M32 n=1 Tax=Weissella confusa TaxID=1583 RepID=UPI0022E31307|nr:carboxypeptidase M32 [Weissella confusa]
MTDSYTGADLRALLKEQALLEETMALASWDQLTGMPKDSGEFRAELQSYLTEKYLGVSTGDQAKALVAYFDEHASELSDDEQALFAKFKEDYERDAVVPADEYIAFNKLSSSAQDAWSEAREKDDYSIYAPYLQQLIALKRKFITYWRKNEATPYDVLLNQFEPGLTVEKLDAVFNEVKAGVVALRNRLATEGTEPDDSFLHRDVAIADQRGYVWDAAVRLGYDPNKGRLDDTIHPFMQDLNRNDARITTRWATDDFQMAVLGILHEAGHGLFAQNVAPKWDYTTFNKAIAMSIHESQSLFNEVVIGRSEAFLRHDYPIMQAAFHGVLDDVDFETFYKGWMKTQASLIRTEADPLTYPLHIIIRYEIEKAIFNDDIDVETLPELWNAKYEEYLGIRPPSDQTGILQDIHWAGGDFGYFPSYALGHLYAAQFRHEMAKTLDIDGLLEAGDIQPLFNWRKEHVWQYGASKTPSQVLRDATGEDLNPQYWLDLQTRRYLQAYNVK